MTSDAELGKLRMSNNDTRMHTTLHCQTKHSCGLQPDNGGNVENEGTMELAQGHASVSKGHRLYGPTHQGITATLLPDEGVLRLDIPDELMPNTRVVRDANGYLCVVDRDTGEPVED